MLVAIIGITIFFSIWVYQLNEVKKVGFQNNYEYTGDYKNYYGWKKVK